MWKGLWLPGVLCFSLCLRKRPNRLFECLRLLTSCIVLPSFVQKNGGRLWTQNLPSLEPLTVLQLPEEAICKMWNLGHDIRALYFSSLGRLASRRRPENETPNHLCYTCIYSSLLSKHIVLCNQLWLTWLLNHKHWTLTHRPLTCGGPAHKNHIFKFVKRFFESVWGGWIMWCLCSAAIRPNTAVRSRLGFPHLSYT